MLTRLTKHDNHQIQVHLTRGRGPHYAALRCVKCNKHIQWLSESQANQIRQLIKEK